MIVGQQICLFRMREGPTVGTRGKLQQSFQLPRLRLCPLLFQAAQGGVHPVEVIADGFRRCGVVGWIGCGLGQVGVAQS